MRQSTRDGVIGGLVQTFLNTNAVRFEYVLPDRTKADYVLCDRFGRAICVIEAKKAAINPAEAEAQAKAYAAQLKVPYSALLSRMFSGRIHSQIQYAAALAEVEKAAVA